MYLEIFEIGQIGSKFYHQVLEKNLNSTMKSNLNTLNQDNTTIQGSTNHNYAPLNHILEHIFSNSLPPPIIVCTSAKGALHGKIILYVMMLKAQAHLYMSCVIFQRLFFST